MEFWGFAAAFGFTPTGVLGLSQVIPISMDRNHSMKLESHRALWNIITSVATPFDFHQRNLASQSSLIREWLRFVTNFFSRGREIGQREAETNFPRVSHCTLDTLATPATATEYKRDLSSP